MRPFIAIYFPEEEKEALIAFRILRQKEKKNLKGGNNSILMSLFRREHEVPRSPNI